LSLNPGGIRTGLPKHVAAEELGKGNKEVDTVMKSAEQGAATTI